MGEVSSGVGPPHTSGSCRWDDMGLYGKGISYMGANGSSLGYNWEYRGSRSVLHHCSSSVTAAVKFMRQLISIWL